MSDTQIRDVPARPRRRRSDGERSRKAILREAGQLATIEGISGLSLFRLAGAVGMSKSGLFAHFGSKEELQVATIEAARAVFAEQVIEPAMIASTGLERLRRVGQTISGMSKAACIRAAASSRRSPPRWPCARARYVTARFRSWTSSPGKRHVETAIRDAQAEGAIDASEDAEQLAFELDGYLSLANAHAFAVSQESARIDRARRTLKRRIDAAATAG